MTEWTQEFPFELRVCAWAERAWPPGSELDDGQIAVVGRQVGTRDRRWDTVVAVADAEALRKRAAFGERALDRALLRVVRNAPATYEWYRDALPEWTAWRYVREAVHRAADRDLVETRRDGNRLELRRRWPYPDWLDRLVAVENKPDLDRSAARDLAGQLEHDVALSLADEAWVATRRTGDRVEPALLADVPVEAGVVAVDPSVPVRGARTDGSEGVGDDGAGDGPAAADGGVADGPRRDAAGEAGARDGDAGGTGDADATDAAATVLWHPRDLAVGDPGTRIVERPSGSRHDQSAARFEYVDPDVKELTRLAIAERVYERGWRSYVDSMRSDCRHFGLERDGGHLLPACAAKERCPSTYECSGRCGEFEPEPPAWRTRGWPIEGGPGAGLSELLDARRRRRRPK